MPSELPQLSIASGGGLTTVVSIESLDDHHWKLGIIVVTPSGDMLRDTGIFHDMVEIADAISTLLGVISKIQAKLNLSKGVEENQAEGAPFAKEIKSVVKKKMDN